MDITIAILAFSSIFTSFVVLSHNFIDYSKGQYKIGGAR